MGSFGQDVVYALRQFRRAPGYAALAIAILALGTGANALMFSVIDSVLLRPLPYADASQLVDLNRVDPQGRGGSISLPTFLDIRAQVKSLRAVAAYRGRSVSLRLPSGDAIHIGAIESSANLFDLLGVRPMLGRTFLDDEDQPGNPCVAVLSADIWRERFGGDRAAIGTRFSLDGAPCTVVGVMPSGIAFPPSASDAVWTPMHPSGQLLQRDTDYLNAIGRLQRGVTAQTARNELNVLSDNIVKANSDEKGTHIGITPYLDTITAESRPALFALLGAVILLLLITCANVANLQLARALGRKREFAIRAAVGAAKGRLARQLLTESLALAAAGGLAGLGLAALSLDALKKWGAEIVPRAREIQLHTEVCAAVIAAAALTGILFGLAPILQAFRQDIERNLRDAATALSGARRQQRVRDFLVAGQLALAIILLAGSGLLLRTLYHLLHQDLGFSAERVLTLQTAIPGSSYKGRDLTAALYGPEIDRLRQLPGVRAVGFVSYLPLSNGYAGASFNIPGRPAADIRHAPNAALNSASEDFFKALGIPLLAGRFFTVEDNQAAPRAAIINDALAKKYFAGENPIGRRIAFDDPEYQKRPLTIVGVVRGSRQRELEQPPETEIYLCFRQIPPDTLWSDFLLKGIMTFAVRSGGNPAGLTKSIENALHSIDPDQTVFHVAAMDEIVSSRLDTRRFTAILLGVFAALALTVAAAGLYALLSYTVGQRRREIAVRIALGARSEDVIRGVVARAMWLYAMGLAAGVVGAVWCGRFLSVMLAGVEPWDAMTLLATAAALFIVSLLAAWFPARRAASIDPMRVLRME